MCTLVRKEFEYKLDVQDGYFKYFSKSTGLSQKEKPLLLRNQPWDPNHIPSWNVEDVVLFFRRLGFKSYVRYLYNFNIDGNTLLMLDEDDYQFINIYNKLHIKKIMIEVNRRHPINALGKQKSKLLKSEFAQRRQALERTQYYLRMVRRIQKNFRLFLRRKELKLQEELSRILENQSKSLKDTEQSAEWWLERYSKIVAPYQRKNRISYLKELQRQHPRSVQCNQYAKFDLDVWVPCSDSRSAEV